jgi:hypothetical protein
MRGLWPEECRAHRGAQLRRVQLHVHARHLSGAGRVRAWGSTPHEE